PPGRTAAIDETRRARKCSERPIAVWKRGMSPTPRPPRRTERFLQACVDGIVHQGPRVIQTSKSSRSRRLFRLQWGIGLSFLNLDWEGWWGHTGTNTDHHFSDVTSDFLKHLDPLLVA